MPNVLYVNHVEVRYRKDGGRYFGFIVCDDFESANMLDFEEESEVPTGIRGIVELCREEYHVNAIEPLRAQLRRGERRLPRRCRGGSRGARCDPCRGPRGLNPHVPTAAPP